MKKLVRFIAALTGLGLTAVLINGVAVAAPPAQAADGEEYIVQAGDWLTKIADKYYGEPQDYNGIIEATNARANSDGDYAPITNPDLIEVGQKLWVPYKQEPGIITVRTVSFGAVSIDSLGVSTVVPTVWPALDTNDPLLDHAWGAGPFSLVSFTTTPGNDAQVGLASLLGITREDLSNEVIGGELSEEQIGGRVWTVYTQDDGKVASVVAGTVEGKAIYRLRLITVSPQKETMLNTILENFEVSDPLLAQQFISIENMPPGARLNMPFELRGNTRQYPFRGSLVYRILDAEGNQVGRAPFQVVGKLGNPATFAIGATYDVSQDGPGTVEVAEVSAVDGSIIAIDSIGVLLVADPPGYTITIDDPLPFTSISTPVQIRGKTTDRPFDQTLGYRIIDATGQELSSGLLQSSGQVGQVNLFDGFADFTVTENGPGRVEVFDINPIDGSIFTISTVNVWLTPS